MADGAWEVDSPRKGFSTCACCFSPIGTPELRFRWCPAAGGPKPYFHAVCAVKTGAERFTQVSPASVRRSLGLTPEQRKTLTAMLLAPGRGAMAALRKAAASAQAGIPIANGKAPTPASAEEEPPTKRAKISAGESASKIKAKAKASNALKSGLRPPLKAKAGGKAKAKGKAAAPATSSLKALAKGSAPLKAAAAPKGKAKSGISPADLAKFEAQRLAFGTLSNEKLKALLKANDQSRSGNKAVLVAKCADGAALGRLPPCPKCFGGKIKFRLPGAGGALVSLFRLLGGAYGEDKESDKREDVLKTRKRYYCTGFFDDDEKQDCDWQADTVKRETWSSA